MSCDTCRGEVRGMGVRTRKLASITSVLVSLAFAFASAAPHALAKGDFVPATWRATVTGPGLASPIPFRLKGGCSRRLTLCTQWGTGPGSSLDDVSFFESAGLVSGFGRGVANASGSAP